MNTYYANVAYCTPTEGLEPSTHGLTVRRSLPTELRGHCSNFLFKEMGISKTYRTILGSTNAFVAS